MLVTASFDDPVTEYLAALREAGAEPVRVDAAAGALRRAGEMAITA